LKQDRDDAKAISGERVARIRFRGAKGALMLRRRQTGPRCAGKQFVERGKSLVDHRTKKKGVKELICKSVESGRRDRGMETMQPKSFQRGGWGASKWVVGGGKQGISI